MISKNFDRVSESLITTFICQSKKNSDDSLLDNIENISDLWVLAKINETYRNEKFNIHNDNTNTTVDMCLPN